MDMPTTDAGAVATEDPANKLSLRIDAINSLTREGPRSVTFTVMHQDVRVGAGQFEVEAAQAALLVGHATYLMVKTGQ